MGAFNKFALHVVQGLGNLASVEKRIDTYTDFYITSYELVGQDNVHPKQWKLLANDPKFKDQICYLVTAVQENKRNLRPRKFILNEEQAKKLGLLDKEMGQKVGAQTQVILNAKVTFHTLGQYLEDLMLGWGPAKIYPRVQAFSFPDIERINSLLSNPQTKIRKSAKWWFLGKKPKTPTPN